MSRVKLQICENIPPNAYNWRATEIAGPESAGPNVGAEKMQVRKRKPEHQRRADGYIIIIQQWRRQDFVSGGTGLAS